MVGKRSTPFFLKIIQCWHRGFVVEKLDRRGMRLHMSADLGNNDSNIIYVSPTRLHSPSKLRLFYQRINGASKRISIGDNFYGEFIADMLPKAIAGNEKIA